MSDYKSQRRSIGKEAAIELAKSDHWDDKTYRERAEFQMIVEELSMPFSVFHEAIEKTLGRPVWTHEFGLNWEGIAAELFEGKPAPTMEEIMGLIPAEKRVVIGL